MSIKIEVNVEVEERRSTINEITKSQDGEFLSFSASGSLLLSDYFGPSGRGSDCTLSVQTTEGRVDIPIAGNTVCLKEDTITLKVPESGRHIVSGISEGDRFIFALHRPEKRP